VKAALLLAVAALVAAGVDRSEFRWTRALSAPEGSGPIAFGADPSLFAHGGSDLSGLRIVDADGTQIPWRPFPPAPAAPPRRLTLLDNGREGGAAVALVDLGATRTVHDRVDVDIPGHSFVGTVTVSGSDDRRTFTVLGSTRIFDLQGAGGRVRSTAVTFPPSDFRYLRLRATGVPRLGGATISGSSPDARPRPVSAIVHGRTIDLGGANVPVDALLVTASNARYDRFVRIAARNGAGAWQPIGRARIYRLFGKTSPPIELATRTRYLRVTVENGDDPPLSGIELQPLARPRTILVEGGHGAHLVLLYGGRARKAPEYEFARLPRGALGLDRIRRGRLGQAQLNTAFEPARESGSWVKRHPAVVAAALALAAAVVALAGFLALRRRV
jgi:hypothetical protein